MPYSINTKVHKMVNTHIKSLQISQDSIVTQKAQITAHIQWHTHTGGLTCQ